MLSADSFLEDFHDEFNELLCRTIISLKSGSSVGMQKLAQCVVCLNHGMITKWCIWDVGRLWSQLISLHIFDVLVINRKNEHRILGGKN